MSRRKKQSLIFLPVYVDKENKKTFSPFRVEQEENEKQEKVMKAVANDMAKDKYGEDYYKPMNRKTRRAKAKDLRRYENRYGKKPLVKDEADDQSSGT